MNGFGSNFVRWVDVTRILICTCLSDNDADARSWGNEKAETSVPHKVLSHFRRNSSVLLILVNLSDEHHTHILCYQFSREKSLLR